MSVELKRVGTVGRVGDHHDRGEEAVLVSMRG